MEETSTDVRFLATALTGRAQLVYVCMYVYHIKFWPVTQIAGGTMKANCQDMTTPTRQLAKRGRDSTQISFLSLPHTHTHSQ